MYLSVSVLVILERSGSNHINKVLWYLSCQGPQSSSSTSSWPSLRGTKTTGLSLGLVGASQQQTVALIGASMSEPHTCQMVFIAIYICIYAYHSINKCPVF